MVSCLTKHEKNYKSLYGKLTSVSIITLKTLYFHLFFFSFTSSMKIILDDFMLLEFGAVRQFSEHYFKPYHYRNRI